MKELTNCIVLYILKGLLLATYLIKISISRSSASAREVGVLQFFRVTLLFLIGNYILTLFNILEYKSSFFISLLLFPL